MPLKEQVYLINIGIDIKILILFWEIIKEELLKWTRLVKL